MTIKQRNYYLLKRRVTSLFLAFLMVWILLPKEAFASTELRVTELNLRLIRKDDGDYAGIDVRGQNLEGARIFFNTIELSRIPQVKVLQNNPFRYEVEYKIGNGNEFPINTATNTIQTVRTVGGATETQSFNFQLNIGTEFPTINFTDNRVLLNEEFIINGSNLGEDVDRARRRIVLGGIENSIASPLTSTQARVASLNGPAGNPVDLGYRVYGNDPDPAKKTSFTFVLHRAVTPVNKIPGLDNLSVIPNRGPIAGGTILTINAEDGSGNIIEGQNLFNNQMQVWLRKSREPNKGKEFPATIEIIEKNGFNIGILATTPQVQKTNQIDDTGFYDVVIRQGSGVTSAEAVAREAFLYVEEGNPLSIAFVDPSKAKDTVQTQIQVVGQNIFHPAGINFSGQGATVAVNENINIVEEGGIPYLKVTYDLSNNPTYGGAIIESIERRISLRIGDIATPVIKNSDEESLKIQNTPNEQSHYSTRNVDGILFETPSITNITRPKYDVVLETSTYITLLGGRELPEIRERAILRDYFEYEQTIVRPVITKIEPMHGYYNDVNPDAVKPIWLRITGSNFQVVKTEDEDNPVKFPDVTLRRNDGTTLAPFKDNIDVEVVKVLRGTDIVDGEFIRFGDTMVIKIKPNNSTFKLNDFILSAAGNDGQGYRWVPARFFISQSSGNNQGSIITSPFFEWRYPTGGRENQLQPLITDVLFNGSPVTVLSSDRENELEIRFTANALNDLSSVKVTLDGMDISNRIKERRFDGEVAIIKVTTPRGLNGDTSLQVIIREGLMDSYDNISFSPVTGPILREIVPNRGQAGTWTVIKRDTLANNIRFIVPTDINDPSTGTRVLVNGNIITDDYVVKDSDTILFKIPEHENPANPIYGSRVIQVQNPDRSRSQGLGFQVVDVGGSVTSIASIDPNRGDWKGGIGATIKASPGTSFTGEVDVYFGSQKAVVTGYNINFTEVYVTVPQFRENTIRQGETYTVPVTVVNRQNFSTDTLKDGYRYIYPAYDMSIENIYKEGFSTNDPNRNKGVAGDEVWIEGIEFRGALENGELTLPSIYFGNVRISPENIIDFQESSDTSGGSNIKKLLRIKVKAPAKPQTAAPDGSVTVMVINPDGATAIRQNGFIYSSGNPQIITDSSTLRASRFHDTINVFARDIVQNGLIVAFGEKIYKTEVVNAQRDLVLDKEQEKIVVRFIPGSEENIQLFYQDPEKPAGQNLIPLNDLYEYRNGVKVPLPEGKIRVDLGQQKIVGINWSNPDYHKAVPITNQELLSKLNDELISIRIDRRPGSTVNELNIRRGLGTVQNFQLNRATNTANIRISTPYNDRPEKTKIFLINSDGSQASADFEFTGGIDLPEITSVVGTRKRTVNLNGQQREVDVFTQDINLDSGVMKIEGKNFRNIKSVMIGNKRVEIDAVSPDSDWVLVRVGRGTQDLSGVPQVISITTESGNAFSDTKNIYFMYISPGTTPKITSVTPQVGISDPGNLIRIAGEGFSNKDEFGVGDTVAPDGTTVEKLITANINGTDAPITSIERDAQKNILAVTIRAQKGEPGKATITVINGDGGSATAPFDRISQPKITEVRTADGGPVLFNDTGAELVIIGEEFQSGAKVFIGSTVSTQNTQGAVKVAGVKGLTATGTNQSVYVLDGYEGVSVEFVNSRTLKFKLPAGILDLDKESIIVVNPDTGISNEFEDTNIKPPIPDVPDIEAIPGFERSMILRWNVDPTVLNAAEKFEIYAREDRSSSDYVFVGDTKGTEFIVRGLKPDTRYQFKVRVLNKFGQASDVGYVRATTLRERDDYKEQDKIREAENTVREIETQGKQEVVGNTLHYTVGSSETFINLGGFNQNEKFVHIPVRDIRRGIRTITISDRGMTMNVPFSSLNVSQISSASDDAFFRIKLTSVNNQMQESIGALVPRNMSRNSRVYSVEFEVVDRRSTLPVFTLNGSAAMSITPDRGTGSRNTIYRYNEAGHNLLPVGVGPIQLRESGHYLLLSPR